jgi:hypothetical protein
MRRFDGSKALIQVIAPISFLAKLLSFSQWWNSVTANSSSWLVNPAVLPGIAYRRDDLDAF